MKHKLAAVLLLLCAVSAHAQLYKWVGIDGKVSYSDTPPPASVKRVEEKALATAGGGDAALPYELAEAVKNNPVTLYSAAKCVPCDDGRNLLKTRGIPFTEKTVSSNEDQAKLRQAGGDGQLPLLLVGRNKQTGYEPGAWGSALTAAGYPEASKLPKNYRYQTAISAAPAPVAKPVTDGKAAKSDSTPAAPTGNAPPGFRF